MGCFSSIMYCTIDWGCWGCCFDGCEGGGGGPGGAATDDEYWAGLKNIGGGGPPPPGPPLAVGPLGWKAILAAPLG